ncbi:hypothetical protein PR048_005030 [Dryococelus australis]|uniref:Uncharacterized protein n=1 Tax=Dryococelus australis TaxID=614101 RepID=A0ABQ9I869_9NEOP|nr:hypothetical protein PR048_005030 [Dryococelus australis]
MVSSCYVRPEKLSSDGNFAENWSRFKHTGVSKQDDQRKIAILLNVIGEYALAVYNTTEFTKGKNMYENVLCKFETYYALKKNVHYEQYLFYNRKPEPGEAFEHFLTDARNQHDGMRSREARKKQK